MKRLRFVYRMTWRYDPPVRRQRFTLKCIPVSSSTQQVTSLHVQVEPQVFIERSEDAFGNACLYGLSEGVIGCFSVTVDGTVTTGLSQGEPSAPAHRLGLYRYPTPLTRPGETIARWKEAAGGSNGSALDTALRCMDVLERTMTYVQGVTGMRTTAEQAAEMGQGVCQDMTHVLLAMLRLEGIACRYVCGMMEGEGASHAWAEVCHQGMWIGLDPTNHRRTDGAYIRLGVGRDATDCLINRGIVTGDALQRSHISVSVKEDVPEQAGKE